MLVLAPIACILSGIGISEALNNYIIPKKSKKIQQSVSFDLTLLFRFRIFFEFSFN